MKTRQRKCKRLLAAVLITMLLSGSSLSVSAAQRNFDGYDGYIYYIGYLRAYFEDVTSSFSAYTGDANDDVYTRMEGSGLYNDSEKDIMIPIRAEGWNSCYFSEFVMGSMVSARCEDFLHGGSYPIEEISITV